MLDGVAEGLEGRCDWWFFDYFMVFLRLFFFSFMCRFQARSHVSSGPRS